MNEDKLGPVGKVILLVLAVAFGGFVFFRLQEKPVDDAQRSADRANLEKLPIHDLRISQENAKPGKGASPEVASTVTIDIPMSAAGAFMFGFEDGNGVAIANRPVGSRSTTFGYGATYDLLYGYSEKPPKPTLVVKSIHSREEVSRLPLKDLPEAITVLDGGKVDRHLDCQVQASNGSSALQVRFREASMANRQYRVTLLATTYVSFEGSKFLNSAYSQPGHGPYATINSPGLATARSVKLKIEEIHVGDPIVDTVKFPNLVLGDVDKRLDIRRMGDATSISERGDRVLFAPDQAAQRVSRATGMAYFGILWRKPGKESKWEVTDKVEILSPKPVDLGIKSIKFEYFGEDVPVSMGGGIPGPVTGGATSVAHNGPVVDPPYCHTPGPTKYGPLPPFVVRRTSRSFTVVSTRIITVPVTHITNRAPTAMPAASE